MKQAKAKSKATSRKTKPKTTSARAAPQDDRGVGTLIKQLDVASLHNDEITAIMLHCASALNLRKVINTPGVTVAHSPATYCYTKAGDSSTVSLWSGGFKVGETSEEEAQANGIRPCG